MNREEYLNTLFPEDAILQNIRKSIEAHDMPQISVQPLLGRLLTLLVQTSGAKRVLEIGALAGYSAICLARGILPTGHVWSLEHNPQFAELAKKHIDDAGLADSVTIIQQNALEAIKQLQSENTQFDFIFIDADKMNYPIYLEYAISMSHPGSLIVGDNVLLRDRVTDPATTAPSPVAMRNFNEQIANHPELEAIILPLYDGLAIARVKSR